MGSHDSKEPRTRYHSRRDDPHSGYITNEIDGRRCQEIKG